MSIRTKIFEKIAQDKETSMEFWNKIKGLTDLSIFIGPFVNKVKISGEAFDFRLVGEEILKRKDKIAAKIFADLVPEIGEAIYQQLNDVPENKDEINDYFNHTIAHLHGKPEEIEKFIWQFVDKYHDLASGVIVLDYLYDKNMYKTMVDIMVKYPGFFKQNLVEISLQETTLKNEIVYYLSKVPASRNYLAKIVDFCSRYGMSLSVEDMNNIAAVQTTYPDIIINLSFLNFYNNGNENYLKLAAQYPIDSKELKNKARSIIRRVDGSELNVNDLDKFFNIFGHLFTPDLWTNILVYIVDLDNRGNDSKSIDTIFSITEGKVNRGIAAIEILLTKNYFPLNRLNPKELDYVCNNIFTGEYQDSTIIKLYKIAINSRTTLIKKLMEIKDIHTLISILQNNELTKNDVEIVLIQKFIESNGTEEDIRTILENDEIRNKKINFSSAKRKFNDIFKKNYFRNPEEEQEYIKSFFEDKYVNKNEYTNSFINEIVAKKDWFFLNERTILDLFNFPVKFENKFITSYLTTKGKQGRDIYHEIKNDNILVLKCATLNAKINTYAREVEDILDDEFDAKIVNSSTNFPQFIKIIERVVETAVVRHNFGLPIFTCRALVLNFSMDMEDPSVINFMETYQNIHKENMNQLLEKIDFINSNRQMIDKNQFIKNINLFNSLKAEFDAGKPISFKRGGEQYDSLKQLYTQISFIKQFESVKEHIESAKEKDPNLYKFEYTHPSGIEFSVLKYLDPYAFQVGADTECCQTIGGAGEEAAIDSFINPLAGVLVAKYNNAIISQSYFHFVPEENGLILDNIEWNSTNASKLGLDSTILAKIYYDFATYIKAKYPEITYIKCGLDYNKINNFMFNQTKMPEDPRHFEVDDPYSDFDEDRHLDLLSPNEKLLSVTVNLSKKEAEIKHQLISLAMVRSLKFISYIHNLS